MGIFRKKDKPRPAVGPNEPAQPGEQVSNGSPSS